MKKAIFRSGVFSGLLMSVLMATTMLFIDKIGNVYAQMIGFGGMVVGFMPIIFGVRKFRDNENNGAITFGRVAAMSMLAALIAGLFRVATWMIIYYTHPDLMPKMAAEAIVQIKASGLNQQQMDDAIKGVQNRLEMYKNPFMNALLTSAEPLPGSLLFSLIAALILKKRPALPLQQN